MLFLLAGVVKTSGSFTEIKRPEYPTALYNDDFIWDDFYDGSWSGKMKFPNDAATKVATIRYWGISGIMNSMVNYCG